MWAERLVVTSVALEFKSLDAEEARNKVPSFEQPREWAEDPVPPRLLD